MQKLIKRNGGLFRRAAWWVRERCAAAATMMTYVVAPAR
jgi:hypothetical protein